MEKSTKTCRQIERHFKGVANHWRLEILLLVGRQEHVTLEGIAQTLGGNVKTISEHTQRLVRAGLLNKSKQGRTVTHLLSPYGKLFFRFITTFQHS